MSLKYFYRGLCSRTDIIINHVSRRSMSLGTRLSSATEVRRLGVVGAGQMVRFVMLLGLSRYR